MKKIFLWLVLIGIYSCNPEEHIEIENSDLFGQWNWKSTDGGLAFHIHETPLTTGKSIQLKLTDQYEYVIIENNTEVAKGTYHLSMVKSIYSGELERFITLSNGYQNVVLTGIVNVHEGSILSILNNNYDGIGSSFEKIK